MVVERGEHGGGREFKKKKKKDKKILINHAWVERGGCDM